MKLLHITDVHHRRHWFAWALKEARNIDVLVVSGDLLDANPDAETPLAEQARWVSDWCQSVPCRLVLCTGNHDVPPAGEGLNPGDEDGVWIRKLRRPGRVFTDTDDANVDSFRFVVRPWLGGFWPVPGSLPTVFVTHDGPAGSDVVGTEVGASGDFDIADFAATLPRGSWVLSGHVHHPLRWHGRVGRARCSNPGVAPWSSRKPNSVVIDSSRRTATFRGADGTLDLVSY